MVFELPKLNFAFTGLEPHIDAQTVEIHYTKHHQTYITNLNKALEAYPDLADWPLQKLLANLQEIPTDIQTAVRNNAGGHHNHTLYWNTMSKTPQTTPTGQLAEKIQSDLGGIEQLKTALTQEGLKRFGSGWSWLVVDDKKKLRVYSTPNQDSPLMTSHKPLLGIDVWEHAYYLKYQNRRADYLTAWFNLLDWKIVENNFQKN